MLMFQDSLFCFNGGKREDYTCLGCAIFFSKVTLYFRNFYNRAFKNDIFKNFEINIFFFNIPEPYRLLFFKTNDILTLDLVVNENY